MIIKVVELSFKGEFTSLDEQQKIEREHRYTLIEKYINTDHVVSFVEADPTHYRGRLPEGLLEDQRLTYVTFAKDRKGITIVDSPDQFQNKINKMEMGREASLLRG